MTDSHIPVPAAERLAVLAITRHGIALAARLLAARPDATLFVPEKFAAEAAQAIAAMRPPAVAQPATTSDAGAGAPRPTTNARQLPAQLKPYAGSAGAQIGGIFAAFDGIVAILSLGAMVRLVAPHLRDKTRDPGIVVVDESGQFAIPMLSGHLGGGNALAGTVAHLLGATPVLTTASDARQTLAVDLLGRELGWVCEGSHAALLRASAAVVNDEPVALVQECGSRDWWRRHANGRSGPRPANIHCFTRLEALEELAHVSPDAAPFAAILWVSERPLPPALAEHFGDALIRYRPGARGANPATPEHSST
ncbi:cobalamin biosynthesis protein CbiG [Rhodocyclus tenuis]|uniref:cobalamin biosynthesis central domain-containing protein n=1 Tax=Rhodocyclus gracilis TaxID=2929842 RepID=UPI001298BA1A|nr:cobalamin biosynthesis central domain-containing protein [Rhodocyclus gracilis]MRD73679.1 cobalamin biosynthesis protein CbiG [Rhodocyclus gracilis]